MHVPMRTCGIHAQRMFVSVFTAKEIRDPALRKVAGWLVRFGSFSFGSVQSSAPVGSNALERQIRAPKRK